MIRILAPALALLLLVAVAALRPPPGPAAPVPAPAAQLVGDGQLHKAASTLSAQVGAEVAYTVTVTNYGSLDDTFTITDTLPAGLTINEASLTGGANYDAATRQVRWQGSIAGSAGYQLTDSRAGGRSFAYQDVSGGAATSLCVDTLCDDTIVTGIAQGSRTIDFYNTPYGTWKASSNGYIQPGAAAQLSGALPKPIPNAALPNGFFAGLWADLDLDGTSGSDTGGGSWYKAFVSGVDPAQPSDVFLVVQWKNAQIYGDSGSNLNFEIVARTGRHGEICAVYGSPLVGDLARGANDGGYSGVLVGIEDATGASGSQAYYSKTTPAPANVPAPGTTICAVPNAASGKTITYRASASTPGTYTNTVAGSSAGQSALDSASASVIFSGPAPTFTASSTPSNTPTRTDTSTATQTPSNTSTGTPYTATSTRTATPTASDTATSTQTATPTASDTATSTSTVTGTVTNTGTATGTGTPTRPVVRLPVVAR